MGTIYKTPFVDIGVETGEYANGDALGSKNSFSNMPEHGYLVGAVVRDHDQEHPIFDIVIFDDDDIVGTTDNAAFDPTDAELDDVMGAIRISDYFDFNDNSIGVESDFRMPYSARHGSLYFQCVIRGTHTFTAVTDIQIALYAESL